MRNAEKEPLENARVAEQKLLDALRERAVQVPPHPNEVIEKERTFGERVADLVAESAGSWTFIFIFLSVLGLWIAWNHTEGSTAFDPFPFILLNLLLSCVAALQAPVIMMSQNRQALKDRLMATNDYEVNLRSEVALQTLHSRFDELRERDWSELVQMQKRQIELLEGIVRNLSAKDGGAR
jgi:uncharacterized membrane protein